MERSESVRTFPRSDLDGVQPNSFYQFNSNRCGFTTDYLNNNLILSYQAKSLPEHAPRERLEISKVPS